MGISAVVVSDLHIGQDQSLLTALAGGRVQPARPSAVLERMMTLIDELVGAGPPPTLVLLGDALELALSSLDVSGEAFRQFSRLWQRDGRPLFSRVVYVPGNHDHHVWETARQDAYVERMTAQRLPPVRHTTPAQGGGAVPSRLLRALCPADIPVEVRYPNLVLGNADKCVVLTHGHYAESLYGAMSELRKAAFPAARMPTTVEELERENFAWIDFFWSAMGREGPVGHDVEVIYDSLAFPAKLRRIGDNLANAIVRHAHASGIRAFIERKAARWIVDLALHKVLAAERENPKVALSASGRAGLSHYLTGPVRAQLESELGRVPASVSVVFGHTHKPFEQAWDIDGYAGSVQVFNTGGWVVDPAPAPQPLHGAAVVFVDDQSNVASLRVWNDETAGDDVRLRVEAPAPNPLATELSASLARLPSAAALEAAVQSEVRARLALVRRVADGANTGAVSS